VNAKQNTMQVGLYTRDGRNVDGIEDAKREGGEDCAGPCCRHSGGHRNAADGVPCTGSGCRNTTGRSFTKKKVIRKTFMPLTLSKLTDRANGNGKQGKGESTELHGVLRRRIVKE
jgi:hypothetical protein